MLGKNEYDISLRIFPKLQWNNSGLCHTGMQASLNLRWSREESRKDGYTGQAERLFNSDGATETVALRKGQGRCAA
jgi:hypothetical protein